MKIFIRVLKAICLGILSIYSANVLFGIINVVIPINLYTIAVSSTLGIFGVISIILIELMI